MKRPSEARDEAPIPTNALVSHHWTRIASALRYLEQLFYVAIAFALALAGVLSFVWVAYRAATQWSKETLDQSVLTFLDGILLVFIITELLHTIRAIIAEGSLMMEPFLIVGMIAVIRRLLVVSAEAKEQIGTSQVSDMMLELGVLAGTVLALGTTIFLLRHTTGTEALSHAPQEFDPPRAGPVGHS